jgi:uncharacterized membrane protein
MARGIKLKKSEQNNLSDDPTPDGKGELAQKVVDSFEESPEARRELIEVVQTEAMFAGPLPPPQILSGYEQIMPGAAERIFKMAEANNSANIGFAEKSMRHEFVYKVAGLFCGIIALIGLVAGATYCASIGANKVAYAMLGVGIVGTVSVFVNSWTGRTSKTEKDS